MNDLLIPAAVCVLLLAVFGLGYMTGEYRLRDAYLARIEAFQAEADSAALRVAHLSAELEEAERALEAACPSSPQRLAARYERLVRMRETTVFN